MSKKNIESGLDFSFLNKEDNDSVLQKNLKGSVDEKTESANAEDKKEEEQVKEFPEKDLESVFFL